MRRFLLLFIFSICIYTNLTAQLAGRAKILYDSAYAQDPLLINYATSRGAQILSTPDSNTFYIQWFPTSAVPSNTPIIVSLHGSNCNAFMEFKSWFNQAQLHGCGIIALQWYRYSSTAPYDYLPDDTMYNYIDSILTKIHYPSNKALLHGFSRGSARSYAMIFKDIQSGKNYFCTTISNAGKADLGYPLYNAINSGVYGTNVFAGKHFNLFCGPPEPPFTGGACDGLSDTKVWLEGQGATVDLFLQDSLSGHNGFQVPAADAFKDSFLNNYLKCYNGLLAIDDNQKHSTFSIYPNPFSSRTTIQSSELFNDATLNIYNIYGQLMQQIENINGNTFTLENTNLSNGMYYLQMSEANKIVYTGKLIVKE